VNLNGNGYLLSVNSFVVGCSDETCSQTEVNEGLLILSGQITPAMLTFNHVTLFPSVTMRLCHCLVDGQLLEHIH
jgi:hypothetical protein